MLNDDEINNKGQVNMWCDAKFMIHVMRSG